MARLCLKDGKGEDMFNVALVWCLLSSCLGTPSLAAFKCRCDPQKYFWGLCDVLYTLGLKPGLKIVLD